MNLFPGIFPCDNVLGMQLQKFDKMEIKKKKKNQWKYLEDLRFFELLMLKKLNLYVT